MDLKAEVDGLIEESGAEAVSVGFNCPSSQEEWFILPDEPFHAASTMKVCVMMELFHRAELGEIGLHDKTTIRNEFGSLVDGSPYSLGEEDDSETTLYRRIEEETLINLAKPMISKSSNLATNILVEILGADRITAFMHELGAPGLWVRRGVEDGKAYRLGLNNVVTARGLMTIMAKLERGEVVSPEASSAMIEILLTQTHRNCLPAKLPSNVRIAHKTGWNDKICHDFGVVYPPEGPAYLLVVLTRGLDEETTAAELIGSISALIYGKTRPCPHH